MKTEKRKFRADRDTGDSTLVLYADDEGYDLAEEIAATDPPLLCGVRQSGVSNADFTRNLIGRLPKKGYRVTALNAEKYSRTANLREELLTDLTERVSAKSRAARIKRGWRRAAKPAVHRRAGLLARVGCSVIAALAAFAAFVGVAKLLSLGKVAEALYGAERFFPLAFGVAAAVGGLCAVLLAVRSLRPRTLTARDRERLLQKALFTGRNRRTRHVVVFENATRLSHYEQQALYNALSCLVDCDPLTFVLLLSGHALDNFKIYFADCLAGVAIPAHALELDGSRSTATPAVRAILGEERTEITARARRHAIEEAARRAELDEAETQPELAAPQKPEAVSERERPESLDARPERKSIAGTEPPARIGQPGGVKQLVERFRRTDEEPAPAEPIAGQLDMLANIPPQETAAPAFDFAAASSKDVLRALTDGALSALAPEEVLLGALPKIHRMPEKTLNEYLTVLSYTVKNVDFSAIDLAAVDSRIWTKLIGWYQSMQEEAAILPLYERARQTRHADILLAYLPSLAEAQQLELAQEMKRYAASCYEEDRSFEDAVPVLTALAASQPQIRAHAMEGVAALSGDSGLLSGKPHFCYGLAMLLCGLEPHLGEEDLEPLYHFIATLLADFEDSLTIAAGMRMIAAFKEKFRFRGLSIEKLNDVIFNKEFANIENKLEYIDNLLGSPTLSDAEKNRYISYLTAARDTLAPRHRLRVMQSLMKSGVKVERENVLEAVKWLRDDKSQDFLDGLVELIHAYSGVKGAKNESIFLDIAAQSLTVGERSRIFKAYFTKGYQDTAKAVKLLLKAMGEQDETLAALDFTDVVLESLSALATSSKLPKNEFVDSVGRVLENEEDVERFKKVLHTLALKFHRLSLNGDQKSDLKSYMFKGAAKFDEDLSVETSVILAVFKIEYISFVEQKIARQGDPDVEKRVRLALDLLSREREG